MRPVSFLPSSPPQPATLRFLPAVMNSAGVFLCSLRIKFGFLLLRIDLNCYVLVRKFSSFHRDSSLDFPSNDPPFSGSPSQVHDSLPQRQLFPHEGLSSSHRRNCSLPSASSGDIDSPAAIQNRDPFSLRFEHQTSRRLFSSACETCSECGPPHSDCSFSYLPLRFRHFFSSSFFPKTLFFLAVFSGGKSSSFLRFRTRKLPSLFLFGKPLPLFCEERPASAEQKK